MARLARVVAADVPHHVTQRGNARGFILASDTDRSVYLTLLRENIESCRVSLLGYCLMSNHIHLVVVPRKAERISKSAKADAWAVRVLLERCSWLEWPRMAGTLLFLPVGSGSPLGSIALCRAKPDTSWIGRRGGVLALVECVGSLPQGDGQRLINDGAVAGPLV